MCKPNISLGTSFEILCYWLLFPFHFFLRLSLYSLKEDVLLLWLYLGMGQVRTMQGRQPEEPLVQRPAQGTVSSAARALQSELCGGRSLHSPSEQPLPLLRCPSASDRFSKLNIIHWSDGPLVFIPLCNYIVH